MGITGLLPLVGDVAFEICLSSYEGKTVAIDAYVWLHRGAYGCAAELVQGIPTTKYILQQEPSWFCASAADSLIQPDRYIDYCMRKVALLRQNHITPLLVFDGQYLPSKKLKEDERAK
jgi:exonuclease 1